MRGDPLMSSLDQLTNPASIAIVGASDNPTRIGGRPLHYMLTKGYKGDIYAVNPKSETVQGLKAYKTISDIPGQLDFVLIAIPAPAVVGAVREAIAKGARTILIFSSGFAEADAAGVAAQQEILTMARAAGVRILGPNCLGAISPRSHFYPTFTSTIEKGEPLAGHLGIASQSGAYGSHIFLICQQRGLGISNFITTGNESDLHVGELIGMLAEDDNTHAIAAYVESIKDGPAFIESLEMARAARKPVFVMKVGRSSAGAAAASSHTASLAGEDVVYDAVLRQHGAIRVNSTEEMIDLAYAARPRIYPAGKRVGLVTVSGGAGILMADAASDCGLDVAEMPEEAQAELKAVLPFASPRNPVDVTAQLFNNLSLVPQFTTAMLDRGNYDGMIGFWTSVGGAPTLAKPLMDGLKQSMEGRKDTLFIQSVVAPPEIIAQYEAEGFPCFEDPTRAVEALAGLMQAGAAFAAGRPVLPPALDLPALPDRDLSELEAKELMAGAGLAVDVDRLVTTPGDAAEAVAALGRKAVLKIVSPDIAHKTEAGGVKLNVSAEDAPAAFTAIMESAKAYDPEARLDGVLIAPMAGEGVDCILGARIDPVFGPVVLFGLGGIFTEVLKDVAFRAAPFDEATAREMIDELKGRDLLFGARGQAPCDIDALATQISLFSRAAAGWADQIDSMEINPIRALPEGCQALDALILRKTKEESHD